MAKKLTRKQKLAIIRIQVSNLLSLGSPEIFDDTDMTEAERKELVGAIFLKGKNMMEAGEPQYIPSGKEIVEYVREHF